MNEPVLIIYIIINIIALGIFGIDKHRAMKDEFRIPERRLLTAAFFGPLGAYAAMRIFRHKIRKPLFSMLVPVFILLHAGVYALLVSGYLS